MISIVTFFLSACLLLFGKDVLAVDAPHAWQAGIVSVVFEAGEPRAECVSGCEKKFAKCKDNPVKCSDKRKTCVKSCPTYSARECRSQCEAEYGRCGRDMKKCAEKRNRCIKARC